MKIYKVKVNGKVYEVELESVTESKDTIKSDAKNEESAPVSAGASSVLAPIAGKVIDVKVKVGDSVKKGDTVAIIEAMKLENEVVAASSGKVVEVKAVKGASVNAKDVLIVLG